MEWLQSFTLVDYLLIGALLLALAIGWARGFVELVTGFLSFLVAIAAAGRYAADGVDWLNRNYAVQDRLARALERRINLPTETYEVPLNAIPWHRALDWLREVPIPESYKQELAQQITDWSQAAGSQTAAEFIFQRLASVVLLVAVFTVLVLVIGWVLSLLGRLISDQVKEIPLLGTANRLLGGAALVLQTTVIMSLLVGLVVPVLSMYGAESLGSAVRAAQLPPYFLAIFEWIRAWLFGMTKAQFFVS